MSTARKIGLSLLLLGIAMILFGGAMFTYSGPALNPIVNGIAAFSFFLWLPVIIIGICFFTWPSPKKNK